MYHIEKLNSCQSCDFYQLGSAIIEFQHAIQRQLIYCTVSHGQYCYFSEPMSALLVLPGIVLAVLHSAVQLYSERMIFQRIRLT